MALSTPPVLSLPVPLEEKIAHLWKMIGNTPMLDIHYRFRSRPRTLYVKKEHYTLTGSIKDRMALYIMEHSYRNGAVKAGDRIVEATSGNTGIAFAAIGKALGHDVTIIMPDWLSKERVAIIQSLGADVILVSKADGGFRGSIQRSEEMATQDLNVFLPCQFENEYNCEAHFTTTGPEIARQIASLGKNVDAFVAGVGTGGTVMGVGRYLRELSPSVKIHPLEPAESPTLTTGHKIGSHRIQGISDEFIPPIVNLGELDAVVQASDGDAILMAQKLGRSLGLAVGISSGANFIGAVKLQNEYGDDATVVTVFPDSNKKYLSTDLMNEEPVKPGYLTPEIELLDYRVVEKG